MATEEPILATEVIITTETVVAEENPKVEAAEGKPKKARKISGKAKPRSASLHPPYFEMIKDAIVTLKEKTGSSQHAVTKFIEEKQKNLPSNFRKILLTQLKKFVAAGKLVKVKASYKLPASKAPAAAAPVKKKVVAKPKAAAKPKPATKKKVVAKPKAKPVPKARSVAKPKAAAKPKPASKAKTAGKAKTVAVKAKAVKVKKAKTPVKVARTSARSAPRRAAARKGKK